MIRSAPSKTYRPPRSLRSARRLVAAACAVAAGHLWLSTTGAHATEAPPASSTGPLGVAEVVASVSARHPLLMAALLEARIAEGDSEAADGNFDPTWRTRASVAPLSAYKNLRVESMVEQPTTLWGTRLFGGYRLGLGDFPVYYGDRRTSDFGEFTAGATIPLLRDGPIDRRRAAVRRAELGIEIARLSAAQQRIELTRAAEHRYWDWVAAGKRMQIARDLLGIAVVRDVGLAVRVDRGDIPAFERIENNRAVQQRQAAVVATERALTQASIELSLFLRDADGKPVVPSPMRLPDGFPEPQAIDASSGARDVQLALKRRPEAKRLELVASQQRIERDLADNQRLVGIDLTGQVSQDIGPLPPNHSTVTNVVDPEGLASKLNKTAVSVGVLLDIPILNRVAGGRRDASEASAQRATEQASFAKDRIAADVTDTRNAIELSRERVLATRREVSAAKQLEEMERKRFELGDSTLLIVNLREVAWAESRIREVDGLADYHKAVASYRAATARSLPDR